MGQQPGIRRWQKDNTDCQTEWKRNGARVSEDGSLAEYEGVGMTTCRSGTSRQEVGKPEWVPINDSVLSLNLPEIQLGLTPLKLVVPT